MQKDGFSLWFVGAIHKRTGYMYGFFDESVIDKFLQLGYNGSTQEVRVMVLTKSEMEIMDVLWEDGGALSRADFLERSQEKTWKDSSVHILLNGLLSKGAIKEAGLIKRQKTYGRTFLPTMTREEYFASTIFSYRYQPDMEGLFRALLARPEADEEFLNILEQLLKEKRENQ